MKANALAAIALASSLIASSCVLEPPGKPDVDAGLRRWIDYEIDRYLSESPRAAIALGLLLPDGGEILRSAGLDSRGRPVDERTKFEIGSITKTFAGLLFASMHLSGELSMDDPLSARLPAGSVAPAYGGAEPLLRHLASHTAGLPCLPPNLGDQPGGMAPNDPYASYDKGLLYAALSETGLSDPPGSKPRYSNFGMGLLGRIMGERLGVDFPRAVVDRICAPLAMADTGMVADPEGSARFARGSLEGRRPVSYWRFGDGIEAAGCLSSTLSDMLKYLRANAGVAPSALDPAMELSHRGTVPVPGSAGLGGAPLEIGLAWMSEPEEGDTLVWHNGGTGGFRSFIGFFEKGRIGVVVLASSTRGVEPLGHRLLLRARGRSSAERQTAFPRTPSGTGD